MAQIVTNDPDYFLDNLSQGSFNDKSEDGSGLGIYPAAEQNNTYFAYFNAATSTEPEILGKSAVYINYLIDSNGDLTNPKPGDIALYNLKNTFSQGSTMFITPEDPSQVYSPLIGENVIENIGTVQLILTSDAGKRPSDFLNDIKISTKPRYNQQFVPDYTTGQSPFRFNNGSSQFANLSSSALINFTGSFTPPYYASASNGNLVFDVSISGSPSDTGSITNMDWDTSIAEWAFINIDSPFELNIQMTAEFRLDFSAIIDTNFSGSTTSADYSWCCAPWSYSMEAKLQLYDDATSTWVDIDIDVNASKYHPIYGTKVYKSAGIGKLFEEIAPQLYNYIPGPVGPNPIYATVDPSNYQSFLDINGNNTSQYANRFKLDGKAVSYIYFPGWKLDPSDGDEWQQTMNQTKAYWIWDPNLSIYKHTQQFYGDQYIYIKSVPFIPKYNDKLRAVIKFNSSLNSGPDLPFVSTNNNSNARYSYMTNYINNVTQTVPITLLINNTSLYSSFIQTSQNYDPSLSIPANGVLQISNTPTFITASYWNTGSIPSYSDNELMWLTASVALSNKILSPTVYYQNFYDDYDTLNGLGYSNPIIPIDPLPGDYIRFEYDDTKQYRILATNPNNQSGFAIGVYPPVPANTKLNHFTISRVIDDGNYIIINSEYPASGSVTDNLTGFTKPKYITSILESEFTKITTDLVKSGVLKNQV